MTNQEEQLWNYIDGFCNDKKKAEVEAKLATDEEFHALYLQLLEVNQQLNHHLEIDEPSMSFTRNVMTKVEKEIAPVALKTKVDSRIVYAIGGFFALALLALFVYAFATADFKDLQLPKLSFSADIDKLISPVILKVFLFLNAVLLLIYLDGFLRKGKNKAQKKGE